jgi:uncharacterized membrane protein
MLRRSIPAIVVLVCGLTFTAVGSANFVSDHHAFLYLAGAILVLNTVAVGFLLFSSAKPQPVSEKVLLFSLLGLSFAGALFAGLQLWILFALSSAPPRW